MAHNTAYTFIQIGNVLERADMTSRIVDVGSISAAGFCPGPGNLMPPCGNL